MRALIPFSSILLAIISVIKPLDSYICRTANPKFLSVILEIYIWTHLILVVLKCGNNPETVGLIFWSRIIY